MWAQYLSIYRKAVRTKDGRLPPRASGRDSVMFRRLLITGHHLWSLMSGCLLISRCHLILRLPLLRKMQRNTGGENETASTETNSSRMKNVEKSQYPRMPR